MILNFTNYQLNAVRLGLNLYGSNQNKHLKQISSLYSVVSQIRTLSTGEAVGYGVGFASKSYWAK